MLGNLARYSCVFSSGFAFNFLPDRIKCWGYKKTSNTLLAFLFSLCVFFFSSFVSAVSYYSCITVLYCLSLINDYILKK